MTKIGYLLPTREQVMEGQPEAAPLLALADARRGAGLRFDLGRRFGDGAAAPRSADPARRRRRARAAQAELGTAVLLPALRNPVLLAHQVATLDQISEGRLSSASASPATCRTSARNSRPPACRSTSASGA